MNAMKKIAHQKCTNTQTEYNTTILGKPQNTNWNTNYLIVNKILELFKAQYMQKNNCNILY